MSLAYSKNNSCRNRYLSSAYSFKGHHRCAELSQTMESAVLKQCHKCYTATPLGAANEKRDIKENQKGQVFILVASSTEIEYSCV